MTDFKKTELGGDDSYRIFVERDSETVSIFWESSDGDREGIALDLHEAWKLWELLPEYISAVTDQWD